MDIKINHTCEMHAIKLSTLLKDRCHSFYVNGLLLNTVAYKLYFSINDDKHGYNSGGNLT